MMIAINGTYKGVKVSLQILFQRMIGIHVEVV